MTGTRKSHSPAINTTKSNIQYYSRIFPDVVIHPFRYRREGDGTTNVAAWSGSLLEWESELASLKTHLGRAFVRRELRETGDALLDGQRSWIARKTGRKKLEYAGCARTGRIRGLLGSNRWDADTLRDEMRVYVVESRGCDAGVIVVDEKGFRKKAGTRSV